VKNLTFGGLGLVLNGAQNNVLASRGSGSAAGQVVTVAGNVSNGPGASALTFLGGGTGAASGGTLVLAGTNTFTGGLTIGNAAGTQGGAVSLSAAANLPSTGNVTVNEQGQLLLSAGGTYGQPGQLLTLNGIGENKISRGAPRTGGAATDLFVWQGDLALGASAPSDAAGGLVVIWVTSSPSKIVRLAGKFAGSCSLQKQGGGQLEFAGTNNDNTGGTRIGNGVVTIDAGSSMGTGELDLFQTSTNTATLNLNNASQLVGALSSHFTATTGGSATADSQYLNVGDPNNTADHAHVLTVRQTRDASFGYGAVNTLTATIQGVVRDLAVRHARHAGRRPRHRQPDRTEVCTAATSAAAGVSA
jgi:adhesin HecA-like repeat protein